MSKHEQEYYVPLYRLAVSKIDEDYRLQQMTEWLAKNALRVSNQQVRTTLKKAGREDLADYFVKQEDIGIGDLVRSRTTGRFGNVVKEHWDGETVSVKWETGGVQPISKGGLFKMTSEKEERYDKKDITIAKSEYEDYNKMLDKEARCQKGVNEEAMTEPKEGKKASTIEFDEWVRVKQDLLNRQK
jgi:hypothetical protein